MAEDKPDEELMDDADREVQAHSDEAQAEVEIADLDASEAAASEATEPEHSESESPAPDGGEADEQNLEEQEPEATKEDLVTQVTDLKDQLLRSLAELENVKRRATRDVGQAHKFAVEKLISDLFPVLDSLEKAVETAQDTDGAEAIAEGVTLSLKLFVDTLAKSGVEQVDPLGEPFDPQHHEALTVVPNADAEPNSVMEVMQKGYVLNGRLVRAAKVIVVKGPDSE